MGEKALSCSTYLGFQLCCPSGMTKYSGGSACKTADGSQTCALWGKHTGKKRCGITSAGRSCSVFKNPAKNGKHRLLCCPKGMLRIGNGSVCKAGSQTCK